MARWAERQAAWRAEAQAKLDQRIQDRKAMEESDARINALAKARRAASQPVRIEHEARKKREARAEAKRLANMVRAAAKLPPVSARPQSDQELYQLLRERVLTGTLTPNQAQHLFNTRKKT